MTDHRTSMIEDTEEGTRKGRTFQISRRDEKDDFGFLSILTGWYERVGKRESCSLVPNKRATFRLNLSPIFNPFHSANGSVLGQGDCAFII